MLGTSFPPVFSIAWRIAIARALKALSALDGSVKRCIRGEVWGVPMVVIGPAKYIDVQRATRCHSERVEDVREHFCTQIANLFTLHAEVCEAVWPGAYVYHTRDKAWPNK